MATSIKAVETSLPAFIGYTQRTTKGGRSLRYKVQMISSLKEYEYYYGGSSSASVTLSLQPDNTIKESIIVSQPRFLLPYALRLYFDNGGGPCLIVSAGTYKTAGKKQSTLYEQLFKALAVLEIVEETTLLCVPDLHLLSGHLYFNMVKAMLRQCSALNDRFALVDVVHPIPAQQQQIGETIKEFRKGIGVEYLSHGAAYFPWLQTTFVPFIDVGDSSVLQIVGGSISQSSVLRSKNIDQSIYHQNQLLYDLVMNAVQNTVVNLPPSTVAAATCVQVDKTVGVWKSPTSRSLLSIKEPTVLISDRQGDELTIDVVEGKSINAVRFFPGRGAMIWGGRTLKGNDSERKYISVRRFLMMVEKSISKGIEFAVFEPNNANTWATVRNLIFPFLHSLWKEGAMVGTKPEDGFYVRIGLGQTMTQNDINEGRIIVEIGMALVRSAEFIYLSISKKVNPIT